MRLLGTIALSFIASAALADQPPPTAADVAASCNIQVGQTLTSLGQTQQQVISLQAQLAAAQKEIEALKSAQKPDAQK